MADAETEKRRDLTIRFTESERADIDSAAGSSATSAWARIELLAAARRTRKRPKIEQQP